jgi:oxygen-independent coproporphyrinogen-3 oxidase
MSGVAPAEFDGMEKQFLLKKYDVPAPRYTSYPTVPYWSGEGFSVERWKETVERTFSESNEGGIGLYIHLPFCESLCTFCGCTRRITKNHAVEAPYIEQLLREWSTYLELWGAPPRIKELHLGGGTPTFFSPENLHKLISEILSQAEIAEHPEFGFEGHPNNTTVEHLTALYELGFRRLSIGVQDLDPVVQQTINRIQPYGRVESVTRAARETGYDSVNFDLVYGLPRQQLSSVCNTVTKVTQLRPDRIAFYSYAHVPWIKGTAQRNFSEADLPLDAEKRALYEVGRELLEEAGYHEIGLDHFALEGDALYRAAKNKTLHRNFMGYTTAHTKLSLGLGMSSISDSWYAFAQNEKTLKPYSKAVESARSPIFRGHILTEEDLRLRQHILKIMCQFETGWSDAESSSPRMKQGLNRLATLEKDGLVEISGNSLRVLKSGRPFLRNVCMALDARYWERQSENQIFSRAI